MGMYNKAQRAVWDLARQAAMAGATGQADGGRCDAAETSVTAISAASKKVIHTCTSVLIDFILANGNFQLLSNPKCLLLTS